MNLPEPTAVPDRAARRAVGVVFAVNGLMLSTWFVRIPVIQSSLGMSDGRLGIVIGVMATAVILALPLAGGAIARFGSRSVILGGTLLAGIGLPLIPHAPGPLALTAFLAMLGIAGSVVDMGMNAQALGVERTYGRSIMVGFHAWWSIGSLTGAGLGALTLATGVSSPAHFAGVTVVVLVATAAALPWVRMQDRVAGGGPDAPPRRILALPRGALLPIAIVGFGGALGEGIGNDWSGVFLRDAVGAPQEQLGYAYVALTVAMTAARLIGDRVADRLGRSNTVTAGAWLAAGGLGLVAAVPVLPAAIVGFLMVGLGVGASIPLCFAAGGRLASSPGEGIAAVATPTYAAFLLGPPVIGWLNDLTDIRWSMLLGAVVVALAAGRPHVLAQADPEEEARGQQRNAARR